MKTETLNLPEATDVVVIGAGIAGISAAWFLHHAGLRVVVCEKGIIAGEQSSRNWGWIVPAAFTFAKLKRTWRDMIVSCHLHQRMGLVLRC
jgi:glycine/D-amino acid oxidase-like deaminating enzyme